MTADWATLGELEYVLRLCMLESREEVPHHEVKASGCSSVTMRERFEGALARIVYSRLCKSKRHVILPRLFM